jgi:hypothetical protein
MDRLKKDQEMILSLVHSLHMLQRNHEFFCLGNGYFDDTIPTIKVQWLQKESLHILNVLS